MLTTISAKSIVEVLSEPLLLDQFRQILVRGAHHPHIHRNLLPPADALDLSFLQESQQLGLQRVRQITDLVEHQRTAVGGLDLADGGLRSPGEGALLVAEQLAFQQASGMAAQLMATNLPLRLDA